MQKKLNFIKLNTFMIAYKTFIWSRYTRWSSFLKAYVFVRTIFHDRHSTTN